MNNKALKCYIKTYGCQMNKADSERMFGLLHKINYIPTEKAEEADLLIANTCTIREGAADRVFSNLGRWKALKKKNPEIIIALGGCLGQERGSEIQKRMPFIDLVFGTHNMHRLAEFVENLKQKRQSFCELIEELPEDIPETPSFRQNFPCAWVNIIFGCNFNCTYCIVPSVRGREKSRNPKKIKEEIIELAEQGFKEITLLGQNVTAYGQDLNEKYALVNLLRDIHEIKGIERIRFLTGHPRFINKELINTIAELPKLCKFFHIPMQSGDDYILRKMARAYNSKYYLEMVEQIRNLIPNASITSDFIVGFPGETQEHFENTCKMIKEIEFASCITAMYSPRKNTQAAKWEENLELKIPEEEKKQRINIINQVVETTAENFAKKIYENTIQKILIEKINEEEPPFRGLGVLAFGRTDGGKICEIQNINIPIQLGDIIDVKIKDINAWKLTGNIV